MSEIYLDVDDDRFNVGTALPSDRVQLSEREDEETIRKTKQLAGNFMDNMYRVMPEILRDQHRSGEKSKEKIHKVEARAKTSTLNAVDHQRALGWNGLKTAGLVMGVALLKFVPGCNDVDKQLIDLGSNQLAPNIMGMFKSGIEGNLTKANNDVTLQMNKYNMLSTQQQSEGNRRQEMTEVLNKGNRLLESAARNG